MATLSPSELAALLGPFDHKTVERSVAAPDDTPRWSHFADEFARSLTARLRPLVRAAARVQPSSQRTLSAEAVAATNDVRSVVSFWQSNQSLEPLAVVLSSPLVTTFVDRLLGGRSEPNFDEPTEHRPLTDIDHRLATRLIDAARQCVMELATSESPLDLSDLPPHATSFAEAWLSDCSLRQLSFELRFVQGGGSLDLLLPLDVANAFTGQDAENDVIGTQPAIEKHVLPTEDARGQSAPRSVVVAQLARTRLSANDLESLAVGDMLLTDVAFGNALEVLIDGQPRFRAEAGTLDGHKAVRLRLLAATE
ncbi:MAG TPA: FliM/FliN family flagellar motor switch protein [Planctomycetaceae bacterium]|nr:FliM/FliN family flagellar motor switch protein [Planctomycetaceae bacterium]